MSQRSPQAVLYQKSVGHREILEKKYEISKRKEDHIIKLGVYKLSNYSPALDGQDLQDKMQHAERESQTYTRLILPKVQISNNPKD